MDLLNRHSPDWLLRAREWEPLWRGVLNRRGARHWRRYGAQVAGPAGLEVVKALSHSGIAVTRVDDFLPERLFCELERTAAATQGRRRVQEELSRKEAGDVQDKEDQLVHLYGGYYRDHPVLDFSNPFTRLALHDAVLQTVGDYLGVSPRFHLFTLHSTTVRPPGSPRAFSQRWHQDPEDRKQVKLFVYLTDVLEEGAGPFTYLAGGHAGGWNRSRVKRRPLRGNYIDERKFAKSFAAEDVRTCLGPSGTMIFADTSGFHRGGYCTTQRRVMFAATYTSQAALMQRNFLIEEPLPDWLSPLARQALS